MNAEEQNIAIAEACGIKVCQHSPSIWEQRGTDGDSELYCPDCREYLHNMRCPDYLHDLNAIHEAEKHVDRISYFRALEHIVDRDSGDIVKPFAVGDATASQRAEAFLRTIGKWKETPNPK